MSDDEALEIPVSDCPAVVYRNEYYSVPQPIADAAVLLLNTEGHEDPVVRALRKAAVQTLSALNQLMQGDDDLVVSETEKILDNARIVSVSAVSAEDAFSPDCVVAVAEEVPPPLDIEPPEYDWVENPEPPEPSDEAIVDVNPARVRKWAAEHGYELSDRGRIPGHVIIAYKEAAGL